MESVYQTISKIRPEGYSCLTDCQADKKITTLRWVHMYLKDAIQIAMQLTRHVASQTVPD
jgi:hypothetical protein